MIRRVVIALGAGIAIALLAVASWRLLRNSGDYSHSTAALVMIADIKKQLETYRRLNGFYPTEQQGLAALVGRPESSPVPQNWTRQYDQLPLDPWGHAFIYRHPRDSAAELDVFSLGRDGVESDDDIHAPH